MCGGGDNGAEVDVGGVEHAVGGEALEVFDDDGEVRGEAREERVEGGGEVGLEGLGDKLVGEGFEEEDGTGESVEGW